VTVSDGQAHNRISLQLFGGPRVTLAGQEVTLPTELVRRVLALLALAAPRLISRSALAGWFWPEMEQRRAGHNLATTLFRLRKALPPLPLLLDDGQALGLNPALWQIDISEFRALQQQIEQHEHRAADRCLRCLAAAQRISELAGEPLLARLRPLNDDELHSWLHVERDVQHQTLTAATVLLARAALRCGDAAAAAEVLRRALRVDPWHDELQRLLLQALAATAGPPAALAAYRQQQRQLRRRFGLAPTAETRALAEALSSGQTVLPPPALLRTDGDPAPQDDLPADVLLADLIAQPETRVVTVIGTTVVQRSRLIAAAGARLARTFDGGTLWLAEAADAETLLGRLRRLLALPADAELPALAAALNRQPPLVAIGRLGNDGTAPALAAELCSRCPQLVLLVGRETPCLIAQEQIYHLLESTP
jgi:DNA-binding SARP family transcriptional activator